MRLVLLTTLLLAGCTSTRAIDATSAAEIAEAQAAVVGQRATVRLASGDRHRGRVQFLRLDSTAWASPSTLYTVPTSAVRSIVFAAPGPDAGAALRGAGIGAAAGALAGGTFGDDFGVLIFGLTGAGVGWLAGAVSGPVVSRIVLYDPADEPAAGPSE